jgi:hypothetical protein
VPIRLDVHSRIFIEGFRSPEKIEWRLPHDLSFSTKPFPHFDQKEI